jgi:hypothetical protein
MKNVTYLGLCWATTLAMVAVALGQQRYDAPAQQAPPAPGQPGAQAAPPAYEAGALPGGPAAMNPNDMHAKNGASNGHLPAPGQQQERSMMNGQSRGELGVWLVPSGDRGIAIRRLTRGSAAEQAGLRPGDIILQVNGQSTTTPEATAEIIRQIPVGQEVTLAIVRDGAPQTLKVAMRERRSRMAGEMSSGPDRDMTNDYQVGFRGDEEMSAGGGSSSRIMRLEQQIAKLTQELTAMRQELTELRQAAAGAPRVPHSEAAPGAAPVEPSPPPVVAPPAATTPPPAAATEEKPKPPVTEPAKPATPPPAEKAGAGSPFGEAAPPSKTEEKPKTDSTPKKDNSADSLFQ